MLFNNIWNSSFLKAVRSPIYWVKVHNTETGEELFYLNEAGNAFFEAMPQKVFFKLCLAYVQQTYPDAVLHEDSIYLEKGILQLVKQPNCVMSVTGKTLALDTALNKYKEGLDNLHKRETHLITWDSPRKGKPPISHGVTMEEASIFLSFVGRCPTYRNILVYANDMSIFELARTLIKRGLIKDEMDSYFLHILFRKICDTFPKSTKLSYEIKFNLIENKVII